MSASEKFKQELIDRLAPQWAGVVHNQDDGIWMAEQAVGDVLEAIRKAGGVVMMPQAWSDVSLGEQYAASCFVNRRSKQDSYMGDEVTVFVNVLEVPLAKDSGS